jgi:hypothetical protein
VYDPNWGQAQSFELIYVDETRDSVEIDPYFPEAGSYTLDASRKTTPKWLKINPTSGILYGTPRVTDLPYADTTVQVTVLVTDAGGLKDLRTYDLRVLARNHTPKLLTSPIIKCYEQGKPYTDTIRVTDIDLARRQADNEILTFAVIPPTEGEWTFTPDRLSSPIADTQTVAISTTNLQGNVVNGRITIRVEVTDRQGAKDTLTYQVAISAQTRFVADVRVENNLGAFQVLQFGLGQTEIATRGDEDGFFGKLDSNYCEYELPPVPYIDVFDARWTIPNRNGILRNIFPFSNTPGEAIYRARFQAGGETGQSSAYYPVRISWCRNQIPDVSSAAPGSYYIRDDQSNGALFAYNMKTGEGRSASDILHKEANGCDTIIISRDAIRGFIIVYDFTSNVDGGEELSNELAITNTAPNPFSTTTTISFNVPTTKKISIELYDAIGNRVATLANDVFNAGSHTLNWDGMANGVLMSSGLYTIRITDGQRSSTQQVVFVR